MEIQRCKGMRDLSPEEMERFREIEGTCRDCFTRWGYKEVRTPTIEYLHLFTSAGTLTPGMLGKVYSFLDWDGWSGERVVLRPDGTIPVARFYSEHMQGKGIARLFYEANVFRFEEDAGKTRERWQCGAELVGAGQAAGDIELIALSLNTLHKLGLKDIELRLSHAGLIKGLLEKLGLSEAEQHRAFDRILDGDAAALSRAGRESTELEGALKPLLDLKGQPAGFLKSHKALLEKTIPEIRAPLESFLETTALLEELGIEYRINIASGSGFEYYTGVIFQLFAGGKSVGGGGRYDALIPAMGGGDIPASGFALYIDRLMEPARLQKTVTPAPEVIMVRAAGGAIRAAFDAAEKLRGAGYIAELDLDGRKTAKWTLEVSAKEPRFALTGRKKRIAFTSIGEVLKSLGAKRVD